MLYKQFIKTICIMLSISCLLVSCDKFLDVKPKGYALLITVTNYDHWLNNAVLVYSSTDYISWASDQGDVPNISLPPVYAAYRAYMWAPQVSGAALAGVWTTRYDKINSYNSVVIGVDGATEGTAQQKASLKAEALLGRAFEYFYLANEFGKPYDSATVAKDPGVPIILSDDVAQKVPLRSSVKEIYDFIISDIQTAIPNLPDNNSGNRYRGSKGAAYSLLARIYFYARNYAKAREYAELALTNSPNTSLIDYTKVAVGSPIPTLDIRPDALYARIGGTGFGPTMELRNSYDPNDRRIDLYFTPATVPTSRGEIRYSFGGESALANNENAGTSVQEMKLIIAEAAARRNDLKVALDQLNEVRKNRIDASAFKAYESTDQEFVLQKVLDERLFEFYGNGLRWLDMRRLDSEGRMPVVNRYDAKGNVIATLAPHSPRYTWQVPQFVIDFNPGMEQNP